MSEYFFKLFNETCIYKLDEKGYIYHLNSAVLMWEDVSGVVSFDSSWISISEETLYEKMLGFYIETSKYLLDIERKENKNIPKNIGDEFRFFLICSYVIAVDENDNQYTCTNDLMIPTSEKIINPNWAELEESTVIKHIWEQETIELSDMDIFQDENNDFIALSIDGHSICRVSGVTGEIYPCKPSIIKNIINWTQSTYEIIEASKLKRFEKSISKRALEEREHVLAFLDKSNRKYKKLYKENISDLFYYRNPFGCVYALDKRDREFIVTLETLEPVAKGTVDLEWEKVKPEYVFNDVTLYTQRNNENAEVNRITPYDLNLYYNLANEVCGISENGKEYKMDNVTGEFKKIKSGLKDNIPRRGVDMKEVVKKQAELQNLYELNNYINKNEEKLIQKGGSSFGDEITFYGRILNTDLQVYAIDSNNCEYICTLDEITPVARGSIGSEFWEYDERFVMYALKFENQVVLDRLHDKAYLSHKL